MAAGRVNEMNGGKSSTAAVSFDPALSSYPASGYPHRVIPPAARRSGALDKVPRAP